MNPRTGERLTARLNSEREEDGRVVANRRVFYDFTLNPPKSVSVVGLLQDDRILDLHNRAVLDTMRELGTFAETRVRKAGEHVERWMGNVIRKFRPLGSEEAGRLCFAENQSASAVTGAYNPSNLAARKFAPVKRYGADESSFRFWFEATSECEMEVAINLP